MAEEYYILEEGEKKGPYTFKELIQEGVDLDTQVLAPGTDEWQSASYLPKFAEYFSALGYLFPTEDNLAPVGYRTMSYIIDYLVISIIASVIIYKAGLIDISKITKFDPENLMATITVRTQLIMELIFASLFIIYNVISEAGNMRGSLGKYICGLRVVDADGRKLTVGKSLVRSIGAVTAYTPFPLGLIVVIFSFFTGKHRQTWYERVTDSFVIRIS